jgi:HK97 family phage major capsid protein
MPGGVGDATVATRLPGILPLAQRRMTVRDLITPGRMDGNTLEYVKETGFTNGRAGGRGCGQAGVDLKFDLVSTSAKVIAHFMKASRQVLDDVAQLRSIIDQRLIYGLAYVEEASCSTATAPARTSTASFTQATAYSAPFDPAGTETNIDRSASACCRRRWPNTRRPAS